MSIIGKSIKSQRAMFLLLAHWPDNQCGELYKKATAMQTWIN